MNLEKNRSFWKAKCMSDHSKKPIAWHEENVGHWRRHIIERKSRAVRELRECRDADERLALYERQIEEAKRIGLVAFDPDHPPRLRKK